MRNVSAACLFLVLLLVLPASLRAEGDTLPPPLPEQNPARHEAPAKGPDQGAEKVPLLPAEAPTVAWSDSEVAAAKAECTIALADVTLDYEPLPPIKEGLCGAPAPILVRSIGSDPKVEIYPPATITCPLAGALNEWLKDEVQPEAKTALGAAVVKLHNAASYTCRNRYGGVTAPLSEHALANALDISEFVLASGKHVTVLDAWPRVVGPPPPPLPNPTRVAPTAGAIIPVSRTTSVGSNIIEVTKAKANPFERPVPAPEVTKVKVNPFERPMPPAEATPPKPEATLPQPEATPTEPEAIPSASRSLAERMSAFMREVHEDACHTFGTTLGPEANEAHKNHFHLDMKKRRSGFCE